MIGSTAVLVVVVLALMEPGIIAQIGETETSILEFGEDSVSGYNRMNIP